MRLPKHKLPKDIRKVSRTAKHKDSEKAMAKRMKKAGYVLKRSDEMDEDESVGSAADGMSVNGKIIIVQLHLGSKFNVILFLNFVIKYADSYSN
jgi:hypothetical protein